MLGVFVFCAYRYIYPFGYQSCALPCIHSALISYAHDHQGKFPDSEKGPYDALQKLYPEYTPSGVELVGISGNRTAVLQALRAKAPLQHLTSWIYVPGLQKDDPPAIAILWEARPGLNPDGKRNFSESHAVLLIGGAITNVAGVCWTNFLIDQERLRRTFLTGPARSGP